MFEHKDINALFGGDNKPAIVFINICRLIFKRRKKKQPATTTTTTIALSQMNCVKKTIDMNKLFNKLLLEVCLAGTDWHGIITFIANVYIT